MLIGRFTTYLGVIGGGGQIWVALSGGFDMEVGVRGFDLEKMVLIWALGVWF